MILGRRVGSRPDDEAHSVGYPDPREVGGDVRPIREVKGEHRELLQRFPNLVPHNVFLDNPEVDNRWAPRQAMRRDGRRGVPTDKVKDSQPYAPYVR